MAKGGAKKIRAAPRPLLGLLAGLVAGLAASAAMEAFQAAGRRAADAGKSDAEQQRDHAQEDYPATVKAADQAVQAVTGDPVPEPYRQPAGRAVHYATGAILGAIYGVVTEYQPKAASGFGGAYGLATSLVVDETAVPAAGLSEPPWQTPLSSHGFGLASHMVYGVALEGVRALLGGRR